ncbi:MAG TPA: radical SAM protein [Sedimenticola sp.]|nr:radical SAM protein [Sedimenticola sp.]
MYDPVARAGEVARIVCRNDERKYYRFRPARFYGGIATADCVGCCLSCAFCWAWHQVHHPDTVGRFHSAQQVADRLVKIARRRHFTQVRISGNEPTICRGHLLKVIGAIPESFLFILETNGILIGHDESYARELAAFPHLYVRVSLKGTNEAEFARLTGARPEAFQLQLKAIENLWHHQVRVQPAVMVSFSPPENVEALCRRLAAIDSRSAEIEIEELVLYGDVEERLRRFGIHYRTAYTPKGIPAAQI